MSAPVPLFVELCAGTAALSLRLHRDGARPPVSRMGAKTGYADTILRVLGLMPGQRAERYLWCEPDPGVRLLLHAYRDAALARAAAAIIRSWAAEDPRALWERLRAEGPPRLPDEGADAGEVARWAVSHALTGMSGGYDCASERAARGERWGGDVRDFVPNRMSRIDAMPATIAPDAREVDPREVARWAWVQRRSAHGKGDGYHGGNDTHKIDDDAPAGAVLDLPSLPATIAPDARTIDPPTLPPGTVVFIDPPYVNTTGYAHDLPRAEVVTLARRWAAAGATVAISEAEPIPELVTEGWHAVRIDAERVGQKRTFSKQQAEWVTLSQAPAWVPAVQASLFGGAR